MGGRGYMRGEEQKMGGVQLDEYNINRIRYDNGLGGFLSCVYAIWKFASLS